MDSKLITLQQIEQIVCNLPRVHATAIKKILELSFNELSKQSKQQLAFSQLLASNNTHIFEYHEDTKLLTMTHDLMQVLDLPLTLNLQPSLRSIIFNLAQTNKQSAKTLIKWLRQIIKKINLYTEDSTYPKNFNHNINLSMHRNDKNYKLNISILYSQQDQDMQPTIFGLVSVTPNTPQHHDTDKLLRNLRSIANINPYGLIELNSKGACLDLNHNATFMLHNDLNGLKNEIWLNLVDSEDLPRATIEWHTAIAKMLPYKTQVTITNQYGIKKLFELDIIFINQHISSFKAVILMQPINKTTFNHEHIFYLNNYEPNTGLPNQYLFEEHLHKFYLTAKHLDQNVALINIKLNNVDHISKEHGTHAYDLVLQQLANRLMEKIDNINSILGMTDRTQFSLAINFLSDPLQLHEINQSILKLLSTPIKIYPQEYIKLQVSIGCSFASYDNQISTSKELIHEANLALIKEETDHSVKRDINYSPNTLEQYVSKALEIKNALINPTNSQILSLYLEPIIDIDTNNIIAFNSTVENYFFGLEPWQQLSNNPQLSFIILEWQLNKVLDLLERANLHQEPISECQVFITLNKSHLMHVDNLNELIYNMYQQFNIKLGQIIFLIPAPLIITNINHILEIYNKLAKLNVKWGISDANPHALNLAALTILDWQWIVINKYMLFEINNDEIAAQNLNNLIFLSDKTQIPIIATGISTKQDMILALNNGFRFLTGKLISLPQNLD